MTATNNPESMKTLDSLTQKHEKITPQLVSELKILLKEKY
jgi:hypothetical protein